MNAAPTTGPIEYRLEYWAGHKPDAVAIHDGERAISWSEWNRLADGFAQSLIEHGMGAGDVVALRLRNRIEWAVAWAAVAKIDAIQVGINGRLTPAELDHILQDSRAAALVCDDADPSRISAVLDRNHIKLRVSVDTDAAGFERFGDLAERLAPARYSTEDAPQIVYTSGTTGRAKGALTRRHIGSPDPLMREYFAGVAGPPLPENSVLLVAMPMHHAAGPSNVRTAVRRGDMMVFMRHFDAEQAVALIERHGITTWNSVPTMLKRIAALPDDVIARYDLSSIQSIGVGAAPVPTALKDWIAARFGECLYERYGSTEAGMMTLLLPEFRKAKPGSSGRLIRHVRISIRDDNGNELPAGAVGHIWAHTPVVIRSYLNQPPLGPDILDADGFFRTGDIGRLDEEDFLYITDRAIDMIISGGTNIYSAEVEAALSAHPAVQDVAVIGVPDDEYGERVKAYCELKPGRVATPAEIVAFAADRLASFKRPREVEIVAELPRNAMQKIMKRDLRDRHALTESGKR